MGTGALGERAAVLREGLRRCGEAVAELQVAFPQCGGGCCRTASGVSAVRRRLLQNCKWCFRSAADALAELQVVFPQCGGCCCRTASGVSAVRRRLLQNCKWCFRSAAEAVAVLQEGRRGRAEALAARQIGSGTTGRRYAALQGGRRSPAEALAALQGGSPRQHRRGHVAPGDESSSELHARPGPASRSSTSLSACRSMGLVRCASKPAAAVSFRSSGCP
jgi:hypothetical protein